MLVEQLQKFSEKKLFRYVVIPLIGVAIYCLILYLLKNIGLPSDKEIISYAQGYYEKYGYWVVLVGAIAEGALLINWYLPGSIVVALGVVFARQANLSVLLMLSLIILGFYITALLNYILGRFGWYHVLLKLGLQAPLEKVKLKVQNKGLPIIFTSYIHPNFGALAATASGILRLPFYKFCIYSLSSIVVWNGLWTLLFYYFGPILLGHLRIFVVVGAVVMYFVFMTSFKEKHINIP